MHADKSFFDAILANPNDDAPRLAYADALESRGEQDRAEFIRLQIKAHNLHNQWRQATAAVPGLQDL